MSVRGTPAAASAALLGVALSLAVATPAQGAARDAHDAPAVGAAPDVEDPWIALEDARILVNEDPSRYAPRLRDQLDGLSRLADSDRRALATTPSLLAQREKARLTLARALLNLGDEPAAMAQLEVAQREAHGADLQLERLGPSLSALGDSLDERRVPGPRLRCDAPCLVIVEGRVVTDAGDGTPLGSLPPGTYDLWVVADGVDHPQLRRTFRVDDADAASDVLVWPSTPPAPPADAAPGSSAPTTGTSAGRDAAATVLGRRRAAVALGVLGGVLAGTGVALLATRPGCAQTPCATVPAVLVGWSLVGAAIPTASAAVGLGVSVSRRRGNRDASSASAGSAPSARSLTFSVSGRF